jgi:hypothetical protein
MSGMSMLRIALDQDAPLTTSRMKGDCRSGRYHPERCSLSFTVLREGFSAVWMDPGMLPCRHAVDPWVLGVLRFGMTFVRMGPDALTRPILAYAVSPCPTCFPTSNPTSRQDLSSASSAAGHVARLVARRRKARPPSRHQLLPPQVTATISADRFKREIMLAAQLQHPNIVPVRVPANRALPYFIMPFIDGESLRARRCAARSPSAKPSRS